MTLFCKGRGELQANNHHFYLQQSDSTSAGGSRAARVCDSAKASKDKSNQPLPLKCSVCTTMCWQGTLLDKACWFSCPLKETHDLRLPRQLSFVNVIVKMLPRLSPC
jgi:hypothetical protein